MFQRNVLPPSSWFERKPSKQEPCLLIAFACISYSLTLKMGRYSPLKCHKNSTRLNGITSQEIVLLVPWNSSRGRGVILSLAELGEQSYQLTSAWVLPVWNVASWRVVWCILILLVSVGNVFHSGSSSEHHHSKRTALRAPQQCLLFCAAKVTIH
jgi:hypothetical protein